MSKTTDNTRQAVKSAVASGEDIYTKIHDITLKALTEQELDLENIQNVAQAVGKGISEGIGHQAQAKEILRESANALDDALAKAAEASKLAIEEAASRADEFSHEDLKQATENLRSLEELFLETMQEIVKNSNDVVVNTAQDLIAHVRQSGSAVGEQVLHGLQALQKLPELGKNAALTSAGATASTLAAIGSGILAGIADGLQGSRGEKAQADDTESGDEQAGDEQSGEKKA